MVPPLNAPVRPRAALLLAATFCLAGLAAPVGGASGHSSNVWVTWEGEGTPVLVPLLAYWFDDEAVPVGCAGTVRLTFADGAVRTLPAATTGPEGCAEPQRLCGAYEELRPLVVQCEPDALACCTTLYSPARAGARVVEFEVACLYATYVHVDADGDGTEDDRAGPFVGVAPC